MYWLLKLYSKFWNWEEQSASLTQFVFKMASVDPLHLPVNFRIGLSISTEKEAGVLIRITFNLWVYFQSIVVLTIFQYFIPFYSIVKVIIFLISFLFLAHILKTMNVMYWSYILALWICVLPLTVFFCENSLEFSICKVFSSANRDTVLLLPFHFGCFFFFPWLIAWLKLPVQCWMEVKNEGIFVLFLTLAGELCLLPLRMMWALGVL